MQYHRRNTERNKSVLSAQISFLTTDYIGARAFESLAQDARPIGSMYLSPDEAWYFGAVTGFVMAALAPLIAYVVLFVAVLLPVTVLNAIAKGTHRLIATLSSTGHVTDQAPFATLGAAAGGIAAAILLVMSY